MKSRLTMEELFDAEFLSALQHFSLRISQVPKGGRLAEQKSTSKGQGLEFSDFKPYVAGDDLRAIDWNIYQRIGKLFVRVFEENRDMPVYLLLDVSGSMFLEDNPRIHAAARTALALSSVALSQHDSVGLFPFADQLQTKFRSTTGKRSVMRIAQHLVELEPEQNTLFSSAVNQFAQMGMRQGLVIILSDLFEDAELSQMLNALKALNHKVLLVQIVQPWDADPTLNPSLYGDVKLVDCESQQAVDLPLNEQVIERYKAVYNAFNSQVIEFCKSYGMGHIKIDASQDVLAQLSKYFEAGSLSL